MTHLLDLNHDCLNIVFSSKYLPPSDLCSVAQTCTHLKSIAKDIFKREHKIYKMVSSPETIDECTKLLRTFGSLITHLSIVPPSSPSDDLVESSTVAAVIRYCSGTLKSLKIEQYGIPERQTSGLRRLFKNIEQLHLQSIFIAGAEEDDCYDIHTWIEVKTFFPKFVNFFQNCKSLVELKVKDCEFMKTFVFDCTFRKLERLTYDITDRFFGYGKLYTFIQRHKNLKKFSVPTLGDCCYILPQSPEIHTPVVNAFMSLLTLQNLKKLKLRCSFERATKLIQGLSSMKSLEILNLWLVQGDAGLIPALLQLKTLRVLKLYACDPLNDINGLGELKELNELAIVNLFEDEVKCDIISIIKRLTKLNFIHLKMKRFELNKAKYLRIVDIVRGRQHQHTLKIKCVYEDGLNHSREYLENCNIVELLSLDSSSSSGLPLFFPDPKTAQYYRN